MGQAIDYCVSCGDRVPHQDIEKGKAVAVQDKVYCVNCRTKAPAVAAPANGKTKRTGSTGMFPPVRVGPPTQRMASVGHGTGRIPNVGHQSGPIPHVDAPAGGPSKMPLIGGAAALVVLLGAAILFFMQNAKENAAKEAEAKRQSDAKAAFEEFAKYGRENPGDPEGQLKLFEEANRKTKGTEYASKLRAEREDTDARLKAINLKKERKKRVEDLRAKMGTAADLVLLAEEVKKFQQEMQAPGGDNEVAVAAGALARQVLEKRIQSLIEAAKQFEALNAEAWDEQLAKWTEALSATSEMESYAKQVNERITAVKQRREDAAQKDLEALRTKVGNLMKGKDWNGAIGACEEFIKKHRGSVAETDARKLAWDVDAKRKEEEAKTAQQPPTDRKPEPGKAAPKEWTVIWDEKAQAGWGPNDKLGTWEMKAGELVGRNPLTPEQAAKETATNGMTIYYHNKPYSCYELEFEMTLVKGEFLFVVGLNGIDKSPPAIPIRTRAGDDGIMLTADKSYVVTAKVTGDAITFRGNGIPEKGWKFAGAADGKDHGAGLFAFALRAETEIKIRKVRIRAIP